MEGVGGYVSDLSGLPVIPPYSLLVRSPEQFLHAHPASAQTAFSFFQHFPTIIQSHSQAHKSKNVSRKNENI